MVEPVPAGDAVTEVTVIFRRSRVLQLQNAVSGVNTSDNADTPETSVTRAPRRVTSRTARLVLLVRLTHGRRAGRRRRILRFVGTLDDERTNGAVSSGFNAGEKDAIPFSASTPFKTMVSKPSCVCSIGVRVRSGKFAPRV